jgi:hypothetical protein
MELEKTTLKGSPHNSRPSLNHPGGNMNQAERRLFLIKYLLAESPRYSGTTIPADVEGQKILLRSLMNVREAAPGKR